MNKIIQIVERMYLDFGVSPESLNMTTTVTLVLLDLMLMTLSYYFLSRLIEPLINRITRRTSIKWDDIVFRHKTLKWVWMIMPMVLGGMLLPASLSAYPMWKNAAVTALEIGLVLTFMMLVIETIKSIFLLIADHENIEKIAEQMKQAKENGEEFVYHPSHSLKGLQQMLVVIVIALSIILCISILFGKNPLVVISGLGAAAAVLMLIFQDSILGVVAGVQLTANDMLQPGDWIQAPKYEANGIVQEVTLAAVKVKNWDQTTVTIPPYKLLTDGFQNWRSMQLSKGRRITRSINIDLSSIRFATAEELENWTTQKWWRKNTQIDDGKIANVTVFRMYLEYAITKVQTMRHNMLYMVREHQPTAEGLPIEIYFFTSRTEWKSYELLQADVVDRIIASVPEFGLRLYQKPSGADIRALTGKDTIDKTTEPTA